MDTEVVAERTAVSRIPSLSPDDWGSFELPSRQHWVEGVRLSSTEIPHHLFVQESGIPDGVPVLIVHGGPGAVIPDEEIRFLDSSIFRIIQIHQRGSGNSLPAGEVEANSLRHLLNDIDHARRVLNIDSWHVFGWSWGATVAVQYTRAFPDVARSLTAYGVFLGSALEHQQYLENIARLEPERYQAMLRVWNAESGELPIPFFTKFLRAERDQKGEFDEVVRAWFERKVDAPISDQDCQRFRINIHYAANHFFLENEWWKSFTLPPEIPVTLIHGVSDRDVPVQSAVELSQVLPRSNLELIEAEHSLANTKVQMHLQRHFSLVAEAEFRRALQELLLPSIP